MGIAVLLGHLAVTLAMTSVSNNGSDTAVAKALHAFAWNSTLLWGPPFIASTGAAFFVIIRFGGIPKWLGWVGLAPTILLSMPWFGIVFFPGWILILSAVLTFQAWRGAPTGASELSQ